MIGTKTCSNCERELIASAEFFHRRSDLEDGLNTQCKECANEKRRLRHWKKMPDRKARYEQQHKFFTSREEHWRETTGYDGRICTLCHVYLPWAAFAMASHGPRRARCQVCLLKQKLAKEIASGKPVSIMQSLDRGRARQRMIIEYAKDPGIPECGCGCGEQTNFDNRGNVNSFLPTHASNDDGRYCVRCHEFKPWDQFHRETKGRYKTRCATCISEQLAERLEDPEFAEAFRERHRRSAEASNERQLAEWIEEHGSLPLCVCGCGEAVGWNKTWSRPNRFIEYHQFRVMDMSQKMKDYFERVRDEEGHIPREELWEAFRALKQAKGMTWKEFEAAVGVKGLSKSLMSSHVKSYSREKVRHMLARLAGMEIDEDEVKAAARRDSRVRQSFTVTELYADGEARLENI